MSTLLDLPSEILLQILSHAGLVNPETLLVVQSACKSLRILAQDMIRTQARRELLEREDCVFSPLLQRHFGPLFDSSRCRPRQCHRAPRADGIAMTPFQALPWASETLTRDRYLRPEASWRSKPLVAAIKQLEVLLITSPKEGSRPHMVRWLVTLPSSGQGLTMGAYWDLLLGSHWGSLVNSWELIQCRRLRSYKDWEDLACMWGDLAEDLITSYLVEDEESAVLFAKGELMFSDFKRSQRREAEGDRRSGTVQWQPEPIGEAPKCIRMNG
jgi:hypothetical protein